jgi:hypothetical protein
MEDIMRRTTMILVILSAVLLTTVAGVFADTPARMRVNIGFSFYADNQLLPAGEYWFEIRPISGTMAGAPMAIRNDAAAVYQYLGAVATGSEQKDFGAYVVFNHVGSSYFLSKVQQGSLQGNLPKSRSQKELKSASTAGGTLTAVETVTIAAAR